MCRWFVYISPGEPCLLSDVLITPTHSITHQVSEHYLPGLLPHGKDHDLHDAPDRLIAARNALLNIDGVGVAWYTTSQSNFMAHVDGVRPAMYKSPNPLVNDVNFQSICAATESNCVFAHIRASSGAPTSIVNCHPFVFGRYTFMHNGVVSGFLDIRRQLCQVYSRDEYVHIFGATDSEHLAALFMHHLTPSKGKESWAEPRGLEDMVRALKQTVLDVCTLQKEVLGEQARPNSLNLAVTDGVQLVATRFRNHASQQPPSLYWSETAGVTLNSKFPGHPNAGVDNETAFKAAAEHGKHLILASEPTTDASHGEWTLVAKNHVVSVAGDGALDMAEFTYPEQLNAKDPDADGARPPSPRSPLRGLTN